MSGRPLSGGAAPFLAVAFGILLLCGLDGVAKDLAARYGAPQTVQMRLAAGAVWAVGVWLVFGAPRPARATLAANFWRAVVVTITTLSFFYALSRLPLAETIALTFTSPILLALLGKLLLGERVARGVLLGIALGFAGVLVIVAGRDPFAGGAPALDGVAAALASAFFYALAMVLLRRQTAHDPIVVIILLQHVFSAALSAPLAALSWTAPTLRDVWLVIAGAGLGTFGHLAMAWGYKRAEAARLGALEYTGFVWAALIGFVVFDETPGPETLAGGALIVAGALLAARKPVRGVVAPDALVDDR